LTGIYLNIPLKKEGESYSSFIRIKELAEKDKHKTHCLIENPEDCDIILFCGSDRKYMQDIFVNPLYKKYKFKSFIISSNDKFISYLPGLYSSLEKRWYDPDWERSFHYIGIREEPPLLYNEHLNQKEYLFSFIGQADNHPIRKKIMNLKCKNSFLKDIQNLKVKKKKGLIVHPEDYKNYRSEYAENLNKSYFVLCPRGFGTSSFRLFETMMMGRVPVIISDEWVEPAGINWDEFSIRIKQKNVSIIPQILNERTAYADIMGIKARHIWEEYFSEKSSFHRIAEWLNEIKSEGKINNKFVQVKKHMQLLRPYHFLRFAKDASANIKIK